MKNSHRGFIVHLLIIIIAVVAIGIGVYVYIKNFVQLQPMSTHELTATLQGNGKKYRVLIPSTSQNQEKFILTWESTNADSCSITSIPMNPLLEDASTTHLKPNGRLILQSDSHLPATYTLTCTNGSYSTSTQLKVQHYINYY